jgi:hypothetical protein
VESPRPRLPGSGTTWVLSALDAIQAGVYNAGAPHATPPPPPQSCIPRVRLAEATTHTTSEGAVVLPVGRGQRELSETRVPLRASGASLPPHGARPFLLSLWEGHLFASFSFCLKLPGLSSPRALGPGTPFSCLSDRDPSCGTSRHGPTKNFVPPPLCRRVWALTTSKRHNVPSLRVCRTDTLPPVRGSAPR